MRNLFWISTYEHKTKKLKCGLKSEILNKIIIKVQNWNGARFGWNWENQNFIGKS